MSAAEGHGGEHHAAAEAAGGEPGPIEVRYCGGCNPAIDRVAVAAAVAEAMTADTAAEAMTATAANARSRTGGDAPRTLFLSGCRRACASGHRLRVEHKGAIVVAGEHVDALPTGVERIPETVVRSLVKRVDGPGGARGGRATGSRKSKE